MSNVQVVFQLRKGEWFKSRDSSVAGNTTYQVVLEQAFTILEMIGVWYIFKMSVKRN